MNKQANEEILQHMSFPTLLHTNDKISHPHEMNYFGSSVTLVA